MLQLNGDYLHCQSGRSRNLQNSIEPGACSSLFHSCYYRLSDAVQLFRLLLAKALSSYIAVEYQQRYVTSAVQDMSYLHNLLAILCQYDIKNDEVADYYPVIR